MKVLVVGGSGFIGKNIARYFKTQREGITVVGLSRSLSDWPYYDHYIQDDISRLGPIKDSYDLVINCAGPTQIWQSFEALKAGHTDSNRNLLQSMDPDRTGAYVYVSTASVYLKVGGALNVKEDQVPTEFFNHYGHVKYLAEQDTLRSPLKNLIVRPRMVMGEEDKSWFPHLLNHLQKKMLLLPQKNIFIQPTPVLSLAAAIEHLAFNQDQQGVFNVSQPEAISYRELMLAMKNRFVRTSSVPVTWPQGLGVALLKSKLFDRKPLADLLFNVSCSLTFNCNRLEESGFSFPNLSIDQILDFYEKN